MYREISAMARHLKTCKPYKAYKDNQAKAAAPVVPPTPVERMMFLPGGKKLAFELRRWMTVAKYGAKTVSQYCNKMEKSVLPYWERTLRLDDGTNAPFLADFLLYPLEKFVSLPLLDDYLHDSQEEASAKKVACLAYNALCRFLESHIEKL